MAAGLRLDRSRWARFAVATALCFSGAGAARAAGIVIQEVDTELRDEVYYLSARVDYSFSDQMLEALYKGVPLTLRLEIVVERTRDYLWDETIAELVQRYQLEYRALTQSYVVKNLNSGAQAGYPSLEEAMAVLGAIMDVPILDRNLLEEGQQYRGRLLAQLDVEELPVPLRLLSYMSEEWRLSSEWHEWSLRQ